MNRTTLVSMLACAGLALAGCGGANAPDSSAAAPSATSASPSTGPVTVTDAWAKAKPDLGDAPMTGVFGVITNTTDKPVVIVSAENSVSSHTELHETVHKGGQPMMQKVDGGFTVDPGSTRTLAPGGDHIMVLKMAKPLTPGQSVTITLVTDDGRRIAFDAVAKTFSGGDEKYHSGAPTGGPTGMPSHSSSGMPTPTETPATASTTS